MSAESKDKSGATTSSSRPTRPGSLGPKVPSVKPTMRIRRVQTGFSHQAQRWYDALAAGDPEAIKVECVRLYNCEAPELFQDTVYTQSDWQYHNTWKRFLPEPVVGLRVLQAISPIVLYIVLISVFCGIYATKLEPRGWPSLTNHPQFVTPFTLSAFALSLLLVFRTNSCYARWWEARSAIGRMFNWPRVIVRLSIAWLPKGQEHLVRAVARWCTVLPAASFAYIRADPEYYEHVEELLSPEELAWLLRREQAPFAVLQVISSLLKQAPLDSWQRGQLEQAITEYDLLIGAAERISRSPIPLAYTRMSSRFLMWWLSFLPWAFWPLFEWVTIPIVAVLTFLLVGLENIGIQIEEPYSVLPLHRYTMGIAKAVELTLANWHDCARMAEEVAGVASAAAAAAAEVDGWGGMEWQGMGPQTMQPQERPAAMQPPPPPQQQVLQPAGQ